MMGDLPKYPSPFPLFLRTLAKIPGASHEEEKKTSSVRRKSLEPFGAMHELLEPPIQARPWNLFLIFASICHPHGSK
jgi:hypothetical protein